MASSKQHVCTICHDDRISNRAVSWCTECEVFFCEDCEKPHRMSRLSKNHKTMSAEDYQQLPTFMQEISSQCRDHKKKFELYCSFHACPCCVQCITDTHQKCQEMKPLLDVLKQVKSSASVQLLEKDLKNVKDNLDKTITYLKTRISTNNIQKAKAVEEIRHIRESIDDFLTKLEQNLLDDLESKHSKLKSKMVNLVKKMEQRASKINQMQSHFTKMTQYASELQMYVGMREIEKATSQATKYIDDLERDDHLNEKNLELSISSGLQSILQDVKSFGDININTTPSTLCVKAGRKYQAQHLVKLIPGIEQIKPSLFRTLTFPNDMRSLDIRACVALPGGKVIILGHNKNQLLLFGNDGMFTRKVFSFTVGPWDACLVRNNTVAVTLGIENETALVDVEKEIIIQTIRLSHNCTGVASDGKVLVTSSVDESTIVDLNDMSHTILKGLKASRISLFQGNIYGTMFGGNQVSCYKSTGELLWTFIHDDICFPRGMSLDKNGFLYVASCGNDSIVVVSPDGKTCQTILTEADEILQPYAIDINRQTDIMMISTSFLSYDFSKNDGRFCEQVFFYKI
ncbi:unnamed protein product [Mytilus coruscus]|uniref:B box-type domain-containing protein n=1 Tax=Mytilus coruscus TaxID=42192 RepID=A0A6J8EQN1_MYTCO|nr:unnamed protein product [Mytilus coruscus]